MEQFNPKTFGTLLVSEATVIRAHGPDKVILETDLPDGMYPYTGKMSVKFSVSRGTGEQYVRKHFNDLPVRLIEVPAMYGSS